MITKTTTKTWNSARASRGFEPQVSEEQKKLETLMSGMSLKEVELMISFLDSGISKYSKNSELFIRMIYSDLQHQGCPSKNLAYLYDCKIGSIVEKTDGLWKLTSIRKEVYMFGKTFSWEKIDSSEIENNTV